MSRNMSGKQVRIRVRMQRVGTRVCFIALSMIFLRTIFRSSKTPTLTTFRTVCSTWDCIVHQPTYLDTFHLEGEIMNPFSTWYLTEFYLGDEFSEWLGREMFEEISHYAKPLRDCGHVPDLSTVFVQVSFFKTFTEGCLPNLKSRIVLITGQWQLPMLDESMMLPVLDNPYIIHWYAQNSMLSHRKLTTLPYGILQSKIPCFLNVAVLLSNTGVRKNHTLKNLHLGFTHPSREHLLSGDARLTCGEYYLEIASTQYLISPVGDRPDSYRHWEALGLDTIPICNCPSSFQDTFGDNMLIQDEREMLRYIKNPGLLSRFTKPLHTSKDLLSTGYWLSEIEKVKKAAV
jgi:hypothetical protein